jgi:hypothetical protein
MRRTRRISAMSGSARLDHGQAATRYANTARCVHDAKRVAAPTVFQSAVVALRGEWSASVAGEMPVDRGPTDLRRAGDRRHRVLLA